MIEYPIVFRCCECTVEKPNLAHLESHIWSLHIQKFPYNCAHCGYPAMNYESLAHHYSEKHPDALTVEFKRQAEDERRLRNMVAASIVVQVYDDDSFLVRGQLGDTEIVTTEIIDNDEFIQIEDNEIHDDGRGIEPLVMLPRGCDEFKEIVEESSEADYYEEAQEFEFMDEEGQIVYIESANVSDEPFASTTERLLRNRRMQHTVDTVAEGEVGSSRNVFGNVDKSPLMRVSRKPSNMFSCDVCGKIIKFASKMAEHKRMHNGEKPFACEYCDSRFTQKGALKNHIRLHTGERPFKCTWECGKAFVSSSARAIHEKRHSGERPYACCMCGKSFSKSWHCQRHMRNMHEREISMNRRQEDATERVRRIVDDVVENMRQRRPGSTKAIG